jgi:DNA primase
MSVDLDTILDDLSSEVERTQGRVLFNRRQRSGDDVFISCVNTEAHGGIEKIPSCSIHRETGILHCFGCGYSDSLPGLIAKTLHLGNKVLGYRWILRRYFIPLQGERPLLSLDLSPRSKGQFFLPESLLEDYAYDHEYMYRRGLTQKVIDHFDIGFDDKTESITIPMRDLKGRLVFIKKRPIGHSDFHKYHIDEGADKREIVYGLNVIKVNREKVKMIYLCEGEFDVLSFYVSKKYGAGVQGDTIFKDQVKQLIRVAKGVSICLFFDNDPPGRKALQKAIPQLSPYFPLFKPKYPQKFKDPNDLLRKGLLADIEINPISPF